MNKRAMVGLNRENRKQCRTRNENKKKKLRRNKKNDI